MLNERYEEETALSPEKQALLHDFSAFLLNESESDGSDEKNAVDLFELFREMAELKNEVKLESRQIKKSMDDYKEMMGLLKSNNELLSQELARQQDFQERTKDQLRREYALELIAFCDYLHISFNNMRQGQKTGWLSKRLKSAKFMNSVIDGQHLLLSRFQTILKGLDVEPMSVVNQLFDPSTMCVGETCVQKNRPNGFVVAELQTGYFIGSTVLRLANVVVNKLNKVGEKNE